MFGLQNQLVKVVNFNPRAEKNGDKTKLAGDLKIEATVSNAVLDGFDKDLRKALYRKPQKGEQQDLIDAAALTAVKFPRVGAVGWDEDFPGYEVALSSGLGLAEPLVFVDVTATKFAFAPLDGGSVRVTFSLALHPNAKEAGQLCALIQNDVELTLTSPAKQADDQQELPVAA